MAVTLINPFEVPEGREEEALKEWEAAAKHLRKQPGFISTKLHEAVAPGAKFHFINVAEWESPEAFEAAVSNPEFRALTRSIVKNFPHHPALYRIIRR
ncbi:MAG TPA: antibiotic biosynthesis monooxygenase [Deltaproteobacteria bacterium]|jgi:heme-degrading monooxygenase HmoA|nr:antibiotic biosynthesis monooxygenase [Deltaproteobacteria bacterium]